MKIHRPGKEPEPIYAYSHEEIDEKFNEWLASAPSVKSRLEYQRKVAHENLNADISLLAVDQRKIGYAEIVAAVDMAYEQQYAALIRLLKTPPRTMRDVATVAKFMVSADKLGTLPDDAFLMWARTLACAAAFG
jgi:hypothetical protein